MDQHQQQHGPALLPAPVVRMISLDDFVLAFNTVEITGLPIPKDAPLVEKTVWIFKKEHSTGNEHWDWVKRQCFNKSNLIRNKRREILPLLKNEKVNEREIKRPWSKG